MAKWVDPTCFSPKTQWLKTFEPTLIFHLFHHGFHLIFPHFSHDHFGLENPKKTSDEFTPRGDEVGLINFGQAQYSIVIDILGRRLKWSREPP